MQQSQRSPSTTPRFRPEATALQRKFPCVRTTARGEAEVPDVKTTAAGASRRRNGGAPPSV
jgi:hypothetical protein